MSAPPQARSPPFPTRSTPPSQPGPLAHLRLKHCSHSGLSQLQQLPRVRVLCPCGPFPHLHWSSTTVPYTCILPSSQNESLRQPPVCQAHGCPTVSNCSSSDRDRPSDCLTCPVHVGVPLIAEIPRVPLPDLLSTRKRTQRLGEVREATYLVNTRVFGFTADRSHRKGALQTTADEQRNTLNEQPCLSSSLLCPCVTQVSTED